MKYRNFELRLIPLSNGTYNAVVNDSPHGSGSITFVFDPALAKQLRIPAERPPSRDLAPESAAFPGFAQPASLAGADPEAPLLDAEQVGSRLFETVFSGKVGDLFKKAHDPQFGLRIKLILQDAANNADALLLHSQPWELLFYERHLAVSPSYSIVRVLDGDHAAAWDSGRVGAAFKPRVLMIGVNPHDTQPLDLEREKRMLTELASSSGIEVEQLKVISLAALHDKLEEGFDIVHFMGHGALINGHPMLLFTNEHGDAEGVSGKQLVEEIRGLSCARRPRLFVLNACHGGAVALGPAGLTGVAAELDRAGAPAVVAMRQEIGDDSAICFSRHLYQSLASGIGLDESLAKARLALKREPDLAPDWPVPCLYSNLGDGVLFPREPLPDKITLKKRRFGPLGWLLSAALVVAAIALSFLLVPRPTGKRLVLEKLSANAHAGRWDNQALITHLTGVAGLELVEEQGDYVVQLAFEAGLLRAMVIDQHHQLGGEIILSLPDSEDKPAWERLHAQLADRIFELLGLVEHGPPGWFLIDAETKSANNQGISLLAEHDLAAAEAVFRSALVKNPSSAAANANLAMTLYEQGRYGEALTYAVGAVKFAPNVALFHYNCGLVQAELGSKREASAAFERTLALDRGFASAANALAEIHLDEKQWDRARTLLEQALRYDARLASAQRNLGRCWLERGFAQEALPYLQKALALVPTGDSAQMAEILYFKARAQHQAGDHPGAKQTLESYHGLPNVAFLRWHSEAEKLAVELGLAEPTPGKAQAFWAPTSSATPLAIFTQVSGKVKLSQRDVSWYAQTATALARGTRIEAGAQDQALLVCAGGGIARLKGPGSWTAEELACSADTGAGALFQALLGQSTSVHSMHGLLSKGAERESKSAITAVLSPRGEMANLRPDVLWQAVAGAQVYELTFEGDFNFFQSVSPTDVEKETLHLGQWSGQVLRMAWPEEALWSGCFFSLTIAAISAEGNTLCTMRVDVNVLDEDAAGRHQDLMRKLEASDMSSRLTAKVAVCAASQLWPEAILYQQELVKASGRFEDKLGLALILVEAGLDELARSSYAALAPQAKGPDQRAEIEWGLGLLDHRARNYPGAMLHLGKARALFHAAARGDKVAAVEYFMEATRTRIKD